MKKKTSLLIGIIMLCLTACMQQHPNEIDLKKEVVFTASIKGVTNSKSIPTRASGTKWDSGDAIGVFMKKHGAALSTSNLYDNVRFVTTKGDGVFKASNTEVNYPFDGSAVDFIAYYPYNANLDGLTYKIDVSNQNNSVDIDLLYSDNVKNVTSSSTNASLTFKHMLSNVVLNISIANEEMSLEGIEVSISNVPTKADFSLNNGAISNLSGNNAISFNITESGKKAEAILIPTEDLSGSVLQFITLDDKVYTYDLSKSSVKGFKESTRYTFNVTIEGEGVKIEETSTSIEDWGEGTSEDIIANEEGGENNNGEIIDPDPDPETPEEPENLGDGTSEKPYTVAQAVMLADNTKDVWVKGYIVGSYTSFNKESFVNGTNDARNANIGISATKDVEVSWEDTFPVNLLEGNIKDKLNLADNPSNLNKEILIKGNIGFWNEAKKEVGLTTISEVYLEGEEIKTK